MNRRDVVAEKEASREEGSEGQGGKKVKKKPTENRGGGVGRNQFSVPRNPLLLLPAFLFVCFFHPFSFPCSLRARIANDIGERTGLFALYFVSLVFTFAPFPLPTGVRCYSVLFRSFSGVVCLLSCSTSMLSRNRTTLCRYEPSVVYEDTMCIPLHDGTQACRKEVRMYH